MDKEARNREENNPNGNSLWVENQDYDPEDDDGWITKDNLHQVAPHKDTETERLKEIGISVMTSDFAMQNLLMQIGIPLRAHDGYIIRKVKSYVLECFGCYAITRTMDKQFCPKCGHNTLLKVSCSFDENGELILYRKKGYKVNKRGRRFNIPNPKFGRANNDLILTEDQLINKYIKKKQGKARRFRDKEAISADLAYSNGLGFDSVKKHNKRFREFEVGYGKKNPNTNAFWKKKKGKKKRGKKN